MVELQRFYSIKELISIVLYDDRAIEIDFLQNEIWIK